MSATDNNDEIKLTEEDESDKEKGVHVVEEENMLKAEDLNAKPSTEKSNENTIPLEKHIDTMINDNEEQQKSNPTTEKDTEFKFESNQDSAVSEESVEAKIVRDELLNTNDSPETIKIQQTSEQNEKDENNGANADDKDNVQEKSVELINENENLETIVESKSPTTELELSSPKKDSEKSQPEKPIEIAKIEVDSKPTIITNPTKEESNEKVDEKQYEINNTKDEQHTKDEEDMGLKISTESPDKQEIMIVKSDTDNEAVKIEVEEKNTVVIKSQPAPATIDKINTENIKNVLSEIEPVDINKAQTDREMNANYCIADDNSRDEVASAIVSDDANESQDSRQLIIDEKHEEDASTETSIATSSAVIEIDDDIEENLVKNVEVNTKLATTKVETKPKGKSNDVIEIDDDEENLTTTNNEVVETDDKNKPLPDEDVESHQLNTTTEEVVSLPAPELKAEPTENSTSTSARMHTMPNIFYKKECINFECSKKHNEFHRAPQFALNYFKITKKKVKLQFICGDCYDMALCFYQDLCGLLEAKQPVLMKEITNKKPEFVEILDSSDEEEDTTSSNVESKEKESPAFSKSDLDLIESELDNSIREIFDRVEIQNQLTWSKTIFTERVKKLQEELKFIDTELNKTQKMADRMYNNLYDSGKYRINNLKPLDLDGNVHADSEQILPFGEVERPPIQINGTYYAAKHKAIGTWLPCKIVEQIDIYQSVPHYKVKFLNTQYNANRNLSAKLIAYYDPPTVRLAVGQRVIAYFDGSTLSPNDKEKCAVPNAFYPGIIAEEMKPNNSHRYLIFYDDGYTQYVSYKDVRLVCHVAENVWDDVDPVSREFIAKYVTEYRVNRPMVQTHKGQKMSTESSGRWVAARVIDIDCSLVRMQFDAPNKNKTEWIYRGSLRLHPVYLEYQKSKNQINRTPVSRLPRRTEPFIRYTEDEESIRSQQPERILSRSNSTSSNSATPTVRHLNANTIYLEDENKPRGKVIYYTAKRQIPAQPYQSHRCGPHCLVVVQHNLSGYSPLAKPLLSGWERLIARQRVKKTVFYRAPCGKMFRNMKELHIYLRITKNCLNVENFDFYTETSCLAEFEAENIILKKRDISNGQEKMALPLINYYDESLPECTYSAKVIPTEGVNINTNPDFLICCDCKDDCVDKTKCACWQLTIDGVKSINPDAQIDDIGYQYKRLYDHLPTGIYECNSRCKCKSHCINRVVQHSLETKLQVFKTSNRGWGLRCLNDIPRGCFVCIYAGNLLTEAKANEGGLDAGDEYFAELDYIETVEQLKEGYESDVEMPEDEEDEEDNYEPDAEDDLDFRPSKSFEIRAKRAKRETTGEGERQAINFNPNVIEDDTKRKRLSVRQLFGRDEAVYVMDAKVTGNLGRYFNHSCSPNLFVQNVFVDTHDVRFPWVAFFASTHIRAGTELTWNYNYEVGVVPGKVLYCQCGAPNCRQRLL